MFFICQLRNQNSGDLDMLSSSLILSKVVQVAYQTATWLAGYLQKRSQFYRKFSYLNANVNLIVSRKMLLVLLHS